MISPDYARMMARYNAWQNQWMFAAANGLSEEERRADRGAFFGSIHATLAHLFWGDTLWVARFDGGPGPDPLPDVALSQLDWATLYDWPTMMAERPKLDARLASWAWSTEQGDFEGDLSWYSKALQRDMTKPRAVCVMQLFNHQTHHRGQVHAMLTAFGVRTHDTDIPFMPDEVPEWH
ncbi:DinB family protein [Thalassococcus sp. CAU 1522]|uniref:DinB family protein n=1 Tax=Thalassococcus arenae TaxID=2851652 RepID=A0ABS6NAY4_9RHOB|nr:DinB family protein [Thalassococcus arenae]MBV2361184.1 DinB family protein [Thalassococcus arenae]